MQPTLNTCIYCGKTWMGSDAIEMACDECKEKNQKTLLKIREESVDFEHIAETGYCDTKCPHLKKHGSKTLYPCDFKCHKFNVILDYYDGVLAYGICYDEAKKRMRK